MKNLHVKGAKDDSEKPRMGLVLGGFARPLLEVARVGTFGARKYTDNGWQEVPNGMERYENALWRHWAALKAGETHDPETGLSHAAHLAWNALAFLWFALQEKPAEVAEALPSCFGVAPGLQGQIELGCPTCSVEDYCVRTAAEQLGVIDGGK